MNYSTFEDSTDYSGGWFAEECIDGVKFLWIRTSLYKTNGMKRIINMFQFASRLSKVSRRFPRPDVIIGSTVQPLAARAAGRLARKYSVPFVFEIRDLWPQTMIDMGAWTADSLISKYFFAVERNTLQLATSVVSLSPLTAEYLDTRYSFRDVVYIPNFLDLKRVARAKSQMGDCNGAVTLQALRAIRESGMSIAMFTGAIVESNSISVIEKSSKLEESARIAHVIVGSGQLAERYRSKQSDNFFVLEPVPKRCVTALLQCADALILAQGAVKWGSMNKLYDYLGTDLPIVSLIKYAHNVPVGVEHGVYQADEINERTLSKLLGKVACASIADRKRFGLLRASYLKQHHSKDIAVLRLAGLLTRVTGGKRKPLSIQPSEPECVVEE